MKSFSKKNILSILDDSVEGLKTLKSVKEDSIPEIWKENIQSFGQIICIIGDHWISCEEDYTVLVEIIEEYCQNLQGIEVISTTKKERDKYGKQCLKLLQKLQFECGRILPNDRKELVFFPYLYAMWDSMESVWKAAVDSGEFDVYVVPIPYYERKADRSLGDMHYDGAEYPLEVGAISWESYDIAQRKPDIAYVHNPYDGGNLVTSIHPDFYSDKLKEHIETLVYIPYFSLNGGNVPEHFCTTSVVFRADKVIVQSQRTQEIYVEALLEFGAQHKIPMKRAELTKKILPLGSPKTDVIKTKDQFQIPDQWKKIITKEDGSEKKVLFFNNTLNAVLSQNEEALDKLEDSLGYFREHTEEIAFLWRPHPLMESTLKSMRPHLLVRYQKIVEKYQKEHWGIYDDTPDFQRAVAISHGYYGDNSSVVDVFISAKKPVMLGNNLIKNRREGSYERWIK